VTLQSDVFEVFDFKNAVELKTGLGVRQCHWKIDRAHIDVSNYGCISYRLWDIQWRIISRPWNPGQRSIKVIESGTIRYTGCGFLLVFYSRSKFSITWMFWVLGQQLSK